MEYMSLHRYIRNRPSDTEVHAKHQERTGVPDQKRIYRPPPKTQDQALRLWSVSTDSETLDYQRTNPRRY